MAQVKKMSTSNPHVISESEFETSQVTEENQTKKWINIVVVSVDKYTVCIEFCFKFIAFKLESINFEN